ncbi:MAG: twin arginine-targeting protein translocase TatB [Chloroflexi bacterium RBG_16_56_11]|nr:MAG: twin arginine-targeting protein translocase TatB [Chloroflexi bacterium RBG_16_56_11]
MDFFGIGGWEILLILIVVLIVVGPGKLPEIARTIGKTMRAIRKASSDITTTVTRELEATQNEPPSHIPKKEIEALAVKSPAPTTQPGGGQPGSPPIESGGAPRAQ